MMQSNKDIEKIREFVIRTDYKSSGKFGKSPEERTTEEMLNYSIINIDKPAGITSHQVSGYIKEILKRGKAGHSGTLDPGVTGVLPIGLSKATRIMQWLLTAGKQYVCLMHIHGDFDKNKIINEMKKYTGKIKQLPPIKSAVKRQIRERNIYDIEPIDVEGRDVLFSMDCQAGTYVRKWVHDFGLKLGTHAHMAELRRVRAGPFTEDNLTTLTDLKDAYHYYIEENNDVKLRKMMMTPEFAVSHLKKIYVMDTTVNSLCHGALLKVPGIVKLEKIEKDEIVAIFTMKEELILIGKAVMDYNEVMDSHKGIVVKTSQVFMDVGIYPKIEKI